MISSATRTLTVTLNRTGLTIDNLYFNEFPVYINSKGYFGILRQFDRLRSDYLKAKQIKSEEPITIEVGGEVVLYLEFKEMAIFLDRLAEESYRLSSGCELDATNSILVLSKILPFINSKISTTQQKNEKNLHL